MNHHLSAYTRKSGAIKSSYPAGKALVGGPDERRKARGNGKERVAGGTSDKKGKTGEKEQGERGRHMLRLLSDTTLE